MEHVLHVCFLRALHRAGKTVSLPTTNRCSPVKTVVKGHLKISNTCLTLAQKMSIKLFVKLKQPFPVKIYPTKVNTETQEKGLRHACLFIAFLKFFFLTLDNFLP